MSTFAESGGGGDLGRGTEGVGDLLLEEPFWGLFPVEWRNAREEELEFSDIFLLLA